MAKKETALPAWFTGLFKGNRDAFVVHIPPFREKGGKLSASWTGFAEYGSRSFPKAPEGFRKGDKVPLSPEAYRVHLEGKAGLALAPITTAGDRKNVCWYAVLDFDVYDRDFLPLVNRMYGLGYRFVPFRSKSGGLHLYFMFAEPEPAADAIKALERIAGVFGFGKLFVTENGQSKVEVFPKQGSLAGAGNGSCLFLPFFGALAGPGACPNMMLGRDGKYVPLEQAAPFIDSMYTSVKETNGVTDGLPWGDAPYCVQAYLLNGMLGEGDYRSNFLFTAALYLKLREGEHFSRAHLEEANACLGEPLEEAEVASTFTSAVSKDWSLSGRCKKPPVTALCVRKLCLERKYGPGKDRNNYVSDVEFGQLVEVLAGDPYYLWEARVAGTEEYHTLRLNGAGELMDQGAVQRACLRALSMIPRTMKKEAWEKLLNSHLGSVHKEAVQDEMDTTETSLLRNTLVRYLADPAARNRRPQLVPHGQVYSDGTDCWFTADGFRQYLMVNQLNTRGINIMALLKDWGCKSGELRYTAGNGAERFIRCWKKSVDSDIRRMGELYDDLMEGTGGNGDTEDEEETGF